MAKKTKEERLRNDRTGMEKFVAELEEYAPDEPTRAGRFRLLVSMLREVLAGGAAQQVAVIARATMREACAELAEQGRAQAMDALTRADATTAPQMQAAADFAGGLAELIRRLDPEVPPPNEEEIRAQERARIARTVRATAENEAILDLFDGRMSYRPAMLRQLATEIRDAKPISSLDLDEYRLALFKRAGLTAWRDNGRVMLKQEETSHPLIVVVLGLEVALADVAAGRPLPTLREGT